MHPPRDDFLATMTGAERFAFEAHAAWLRALLADGGPARFLPTEIWREDKLPLRPGDHVPVTARVSDDHADRYLKAGARFTLWSGGQVGYGIVYRRVFTDCGPS
jgi:hypothetical protein